MKQAVLIDSEGFFQEDIPHYKGSGTETIILEQPPEGLWKPKWNRTTSKWEEGLTNKPTAKPPDKPPDWDSFLLAFRSEKLIRKKIYSSKSLAAVISLTTVLTLRRVINLPLEDLKLAWDEAIAELDAPLTASEITKLNNWAREANLPIEVAVDGKIKSRNPE